MCVMLLKLCVKTMASLTTTKKHGYVMINETKE